TDPKEINKLTINHFQNIAGNKNSSKNIPIDWIDQYKPKDDINVHIYDQLCSIISETEVLEAINSLPNGKAVGPSGISYEMLKNLSTSMKKLPTKIINACLILGDIPTEWKKADIYP